MSRFQLWDVPSSTLLEDADDPGQISAAVQSFVEDAGSGILDDLLLSDAERDTEHSGAASGERIMDVLRQHLADDQIANAPPRKIRATS